MHGSSPKEPIRVPWDHLKEDLYLGDNDFVQAMKAYLEKNVAVAATR